MPRLSWLPRCTLAIGVVFTYAMGSRTLEQWQQTQSGAAVVDARLSGLLSRAALVYAALAALQLVSMGALRHSGIRRTGAATTRYALFALHAWNCLTTLAMSQLALLGGETAAGPAGVAKCPLLLFHPTSQPLRYVEWAVSLPLHVGLIGGLIDAPVSANAGGDRELREAAWCMGAMIMCGTLAFFWTRSPAVALAAGAAAIALHVHGLVLLWRALRAKERACGDKARNAHEAETFRLVRWFIVICWSSYVLPRAARLAGVLSAVDEDIAFLALDMTDKVQT